MATSKTGSAMARWERIPENLWMAVEHAPFVHLAHTGHPPVCQWWYLLRLHPQGFKLAAVPYRQCFFRMFVCLFACLLVCLFVCFSFKNPIICATRRMEEWKETWTWNVSLLRVVFWEQNRADAKSILPCLGLEVRIQQDKVWVQRNLEGLFFSAFDLCCWKVWCPPYFEFTSNSTCCFMMAFISCGQSICINILQLYLYAT